MRTIWIIGALLFCGTPAAPAEEGVLLLGEALTKAVAVSPRVTEAHSEVLRARARKRGARAEGRPEASASIDGRFQGPASSVGRETVTAAQAGEGNVSVSMPVDVSGRIKAEKRSASRQEAAALAREAAVVQRLVLDVTEAYLGCLESLQEMELVAALRQLNEERLRLGRVRLAAGVGVTLEVTQAEADLADSVQREIEAAARLKQVGATLNTLIGRPAEAPLILAALPPMGESLPVTPEGMEKLSPEQARALGRVRPELRALREDVRLADAGVDSARAARRPFVSLRGDLLQRLPETLLGGFTWSLGSSIVQSLFDGGRSRARVEAARADRMRAGAALAEAERQAEEQVEQARVAVEAAEQRVAAEERRVTAATEALGVAEKRFAAGVAATLEVTEASTVLTRARTDAMTARFAVARSRARLAYAAGVSDPGIRMDPRISKK